MQLYKTILFVHAVTVLTLAGSLGAEAWMLYQIRRARTLHDLAQWTSPTATLGTIAAVSLAIVETTGAYLTEVLRSWPLAWPKVAFWGVVLVAFIGALTGRRLRRLCRLADRGEQSMDVLSAEARGRFLVRSLYVRSTLVLGILMLTALTPNLVGSLSVIFISTALGLIGSEISG
jgi:hypothetical protein